MQAKNSIVCPDCHGTSRRVVMRTVRQYAKIETPPPCGRCKRHWSCAPAAARIYPLVADNAGSAYTPALKVGCGRSGRPARRPATLRVRIPFKRLIFGRAMLLREEPNCAPPPCVRTSCRPRKSSGSKPPRPLLSQTAPKLAIEQFKICKADQPRPLVRPH